MTVIDTNVLIPFLNGSPEEVNKVHEVSKTNNQVVITIITAYELLKGARLSSKPEENLKEVKEAIANIQVLDLSPEACEEAANMFCELKKSGKMISEFDILIAAIAKTNGESILTRDQHFNFIKEINLIQW
jgi:tRNA(fMet)-specific endonuclease VapC